MNPILEVRNLAKRYHDFTLRETSLEVPYGCIVALFGPIGAGKTTLMRLLADQIPADSGTIRVFGSGYDENERGIKNRIGYAPQEPAFYGDRSVDFNARFAAPFFEGWDGGAFSRMLDEFKISRRQKVKHLSRGQKTLLSLALALSHGADLLILDEPTAGLDLVLRRNILDLLRRFTADGRRTVMVASHLTDGLEEIAEQIKFIDNGKLVFESDRDQLQARWKRIHFKEGALHPDIVRQFVDVCVMPFGSTGLTRDYSAVQQRLAPGIAAGDVKVENASLDDILIAILKGE